jgi:hypothetical protein
MEWHESRGALWAVACGLSLAACSRQSLVDPRVPDALAPAAEVGPGGPPAAGGGPPDADLVPPEAADGAGVIFSDGPPRAMRVFVTSGKWDGNLLRAAIVAGGSVSTGLAGGDTLCNLSAHAAGLGGTWVAWLSDSTTDAIDRIRDVGPWYGLDGAKVFESRAALTADPLVALEVNEVGTRTDYAPWTGTLADGTKAASTCGDWRSNSDRTYGLCGYSDSTGQRTWSEGVLPLCNNPYNLYCFEE